MISWISYEWQRQNLPEAAPPTAPTAIRDSEQSDRPAVEKVLKSAFAVDPTWADSSRPIAAHLAAATEKVFSAERPACPVLVHGSRIIGVSLLDLDEGAENNLLSGPCILNEYRNRGLATALLAASLERIFAAGAKTALGLTRRKSVAGRFIYPKFGGVPSVFAGDPLKPAAA